MQFPFNEPPHSPRECEEHYLVCVRCLGDARCETVLDEDEDGKRLIHTPMCQCDVCGRVMCRNCRTKSGFCSLECEKEGV